MVENCAGKGKQKWLESCFAYFEFMTATKAPCWPSALELGLFHLTALTFHLDHPEQPLLPSPSRLMAPLTSPNSSSWQVWGKCGLAADR